MKLLDEISSGPKFTIRLKSNGKDITQELIGEVVNFNPPTVRFLDKHEEAYEITEIELYYDGRKIAEAC